MYGWVLLTLALPVALGAARWRTCLGPVRAGVRYEREALFKGNMALYLATDLSTDTLYFAHFTPTVSIATARMNLKTKEYVDIRGVDSTTALTVDPKTHDLYIGSYRGVYKYDRTKDKAELYGANTTWIGTLFFKDVLYLTSAVSRSVYTMADGSLEPFNDEDEVEHFLINKDGLIIFSNSTGLYVQINDAKSLISYDDGSGKYPTISGLTTDNDGKVYANSDGDVYFVNLQNHTLETAWERVFGHSIAFDSNNNLMFSDFNSVYRLIRSNNQNCKPSV